MTRFWLTCSLFRLLTYDGMNPELHGKLCQILSEIIEKKSITGTRDQKVAILIIQTIDFFHAIEKEKSLLKSRMYSLISLQRISKVLSCLLQKNILLVHEWEKLTPFFTTIVMLHSESTSLPNLHIDYLSLLTFIVCLWSFLIL